jgi:hypothetical protein
LRLLIAHHLSTDPAFSIPVGPRKDDRLKRDAGRSFGILTQLQSPKY